MLSQAGPEKPVKHAQLPSMHCPPLRQGDAQDSELRTEESSTTVGYTVKAIVHWIDPGAINLIFGIEDIWRLV